MMDAGAIIEWLDVIAVALGILGSAVAFYIQVRKVRGLREAVDMFAEYAEDAARQFEILSPKLESALGAGGRAEVKAASGQMVKEKMANAPLSMSARNQLEKRLRKLHKRGKVCLKGLR